MRSLLEIGGKRMPMLRWSALRMAFGMRKLTREWQVGDGREAALLQYVLANARAGDLDGAIRAVDEFCAKRSVMMNVGDEKGEILLMPSVAAGPARSLAAVTAPLTLYPQSKSIAWSPDSKWLVCQMPLPTVAL